MALNKRTTPAAPQNSLCGECSLIPFHSVFDAPEGAVATCFRTLAQTKKTPNCSFCALLIRCAEQPFGPLEYDEEDMTAFTMVTADMRPEYVLTADNTVPPYASLVLWTHHECRNGLGPSGPCQKNLCARNQRRRVWKPVYIERIGAPLTKLPARARFIMVRRLLEARFDTRLLSSWLSEDDQNELKDRDRLSDSQAGIRSLHDLVCASKFRLIDVTANTIITVEVSKEGAFEYAPERYVALSYVWGDSMVKHVISSRTRKHGGGVEGDVVPGSRFYDGFSRISEWLSNILSLQNNACVSPIKLVLEDVPRTIKDSIELTRAINIRYLWIDSLCINQSDARDKQYIVPHMGAIYANAYLTIVAADGSHADAGLSRFNGDADAPEEISALISNNVPMSLTIQKPLLEVALADSTWQTRGWTYQERYLSRRCIFFTRHQVYYRGTHLKADESYELQPVAYDPRFGPKKWEQDEKADMRDKFGQIGRGNPITFDFHDYIWTVQNFSKLKLSYNGDRLDAFVGLSDRFQNIVSSDPSERSRQLGRTEERSLALQNLPERTYIDAMTISTYIYRGGRALSGLPERMFANGLCWLPRTDKEAGNVKRIDLDASGGRHLPSWSWVGWTGPITYPLVYHKTNVAAVFDEWNVICKIIGAPSSVQIEPCEATEPARTTLHLMAPSVVCHLTRVERGPASYIYAVKIEPTNVDRPSVTLSEHLTLLERIDESSDFYLVEVGHAGDSEREDRLCFFFLVLRKVGEFYERIGAILQDERTLGVDSHDFDTVYYMCRYFKVW